MKFITRQRSFCLKKKILNKSIFLLILIEKQVVKNMMNRKKTRYTEREQMGGTRRVKQAAVRCLRKELSPFIPKDIPPNMNQRASYDGVLPS